MRAAGRARGPARIRQQREQAPVQHSKRVEGFRICNFLKLVVTDSPKGVAEKRRKEKDAAELWTDSLLTRRESRDKTEPKPRKPKRQNVSSALHSST